VIEFCYDFSFCFVELMVCYTKDMPLDLIGYACIPIKLFTKVLVIVRACDHFAKLRLQLSDDVVLGYLKMRVAGW